MDKGVVDFTRISIAYAIQLLRDLVNSKFPKKVREQTEPLISKYVNQKGYMEATPISGEDLFDLMLISSLIRAGPKQNPVIRLFACIIQGLVVEATRRADVCEQLHQALRERDDAIFRLMRNEDRPEGL